MPIETLSKSQISRMRAAGAAAASSLSRVARAIAPGVSTAEIDKIVADDTHAIGGACAPLGYEPGGGVPAFPRSVCTSRNAVVCHGIPSEHEVLAAGDIVNVDVTTRLNGMHGDTSYTFCVGEVEFDVAHVVDTSRRALEIGIEVARPGVRFSDIGEAIEDFVVGQGCSVVRDFGGHGIGRLMHMEPHVSHVRGQGSRLRLRPGMAFTIEPMVCAGSAEVTTRSDRWTVVTRDGGVSAQFEHTLVVTSSGVEVTTLPARALSELVLPTP